MNFHDRVSFLKSGNYKFGVNEPGDIIVFDIHAWILAKQFLLETGTEVVGEYVYPISVSNYQTYNGVHFNNSKRLEVAYWDKDEASVTILNTPRRIKLPYLIKHPDFIP